MIILALKQIQVDQEMYKQIDWGKIGLLIHFLSIVYEQSCFETPKFLNSPL